MPTEKLSLGAAHTAEDLNALKMCALFSNLARGCEKQYLFEEAALYQQLEAYYAAQAQLVPEADLEALAQAIDSDLEQRIPAANQAAGAIRDRGALRALVWNEKVTRIQKSQVRKALKRGPETGETMDYHVCTACGFIFQGDAAPGLCPVCKVPDWKFVKV